ncbi:hypothetical protein [Actinokineospora sp.]|uniref:hypothetical protein n=1 Tax=Actinokineospora sp. TaxID=1872133 RepID=UPI0040375F20
MSTEVLPVGLPFRAVTVPFEVADKRYARRDSEIGVKYMSVTDPRASVENSGEGTTIVRVADRKVVARYVRSAPDRLLYRVFFWRDVAIVQEITDIDTGDDGGRLHLWRYDLLSGARTEMKPADGRKMAYLSAAALAGDQFAAGIDKDGQKDRCLHVFDLATGAGFDVFCLPREQPGRISSVRGSASGFTFLTTAAETLASCRTAYWVPVPAVPTVSPHVLGGDRSCHVFDHARHGGWDVWGDVPAKDDAENFFSFSVLSARNGDRTVTLAAVMVSASVASCGEHVYWRAPNVDDYDRARLFRWKPGADTTELIYEVDSNGDREGWSLSYPTCSDNVMTTARNRSAVRDRPAGREMFYLPNA